MGRYLVRRILGAIPVLVGVVAVVFILSTVVPGDPASIMSGQRGDLETIARIRQEMGLNDPLWLQFVKFLKNALTLNLGRSYRNNMKVLDAILERLPASAELAFAAMALAVVVGVAVGMVSATRQYSWADYSSMVFALLGTSSPVFFIGLCLILIFCTWLRWVPGTGFGDGRLIYLILPTITLGLRPAALIARITRSSMLDVIRQDYVRTARAKGLSERRVVLRHALANAMIPVVTVVGYETSNNLSGVVLTERIFGWPGFGRLSVDSVTARDFPMLRGTVLFMALIFVVTNILVDLSYAFFDPRIRYE